MKRYCITMDCFVSSDIHECIEINVSAFNQEIAIELAKAELANIDNTWIICNYIIRKL